MTMRWESSLRGLCLVVLPLGLCAYTAIGQEKAVPKLQSEPAAKKAESDVPRLPDHWDNIGLTDKQRQSVRAIQMENFPKILELRKRIAQLQAETEAKMLTVLSAEQKKILADLQEESRQQSEERKARRKKASTPKRDAEADAESKGT